MSNSSLISYTKLSPNRNSPRNHAIDRITPHCVVGQLSAESICGCFTSTSRQASCNYGIGTDGKVSLCVEERNRSWCSSSRENDQRAVTIECASDKVAPYAMNNAVYESLVKLCADICRRNGKSKLLWFADKEKALAYNPAADEMVLTVHRWFAATACPGDWLYYRMGTLAKAVNAELGGNVPEQPEETPATQPVNLAPAPTTTKTLYRVQVGAFARIANANAMLARVKAAGFNACLVQEKNLYKVQVGAFSVIGNAEKMKRKLEVAGFKAVVVAK